ncbi:MAG: chemotaxis response regulator protein-glutamate methylesterase [Deltaproteobacteria bacterium]|nr:MAG: chemotaxis response regulator protein-glutamate methylesterase [Deltaproteobacteria bacterium]
MPMLRVLVVDDTIIYRKIVSDVLEEIPGVKVIGTAQNGKIALSMIEKLKPDLITLDVEMPEMNGLQVLEELKKRQIDVGTIMVSTLTHRGAETTMKALELGAFYFIPKPDSGTMEENKKSIKNTIYPIINAFASKKRIRKILSKDGSFGASYTKAGKEPPKQKVVNVPGTARRAKNVKSEAVAIGVSTGGPNALAEVIPRLPQKLGVPVLIVQHMPPLFTECLAKNLDSKSNLKVVEAQDQMPVEVDTVYIAPGGKHMKITRAVGNGIKRIKITDDPPENNCKPSVDYLFRSIAHIYKNRATGVIMTGMGSDGTLGLKLMKRFGATIIAQNEETCVVFGMPKKPIEEGIADVVAPLDKIPDEIVKTLK